MAFTVTARQSAANAGSATASLTTSSATPTANSLFVTAYGCQIDNGAAELPVLTVPTGDALSFTLIDKHGDVTALEWGSGTGFCIGGRVDRAPVGGSPSAFTVTVDGASAPSNGYHSAVCLDITGHNTTTPIVQNARNGARINPESSTASGTVTLSATPTAGNLIVVAFMCGADAAGAVTSPTAGAGKTFTTATALSPAFCTTAVFYRVADGAESTTITTSDLGTTVGNYVAIAFEVAAAPGGSPTPSTVAALASVPAATVRLGAAIVASAVLAAASIPAPSVSTGSNATATPAVVAAAVQVPAPTMHTGAVVTPATVSAVAAIPTPGVGTGAAPATVQGTASVPAVTVRLGVSITPSVVHAAAAIPAPSLYKYVTGASANGRYFVDQDGSPILVRGDSPWSMFQHLSASEMDIYLANRRSYGANVLLCSMIGATANGAPSDNGATYDGILPFTGGDVTVFNSAYWTRMDSYIAKARDAGFTLMIYPIDGWTTLTGNVFDPASVGNTACQTYGQTLATRYLSYPNIIWAFGGDYFETGTINARFDACLTGIRAAGDTRPVTIQLGYEFSESSESTFWDDKVDWNFVYNYRATYKGMKDGYDFTWPASPTTRPALFGEGAYEGSTDPNHPGTDLVIRRQAGWALTSGSPGEFTGQEGVWNFFSDWQDRLDTTAAGQLKAIRDALQGVAWWTLVPDDSSQLVTAGRGTRVTTDAATYPSGNTFVTAARAADGTLAVIYMPNASSAITVDMTKIGASPTATWVDPTSGATFGATVGSSYSRGNNAAGSTDWLLILTGLAGTTVTPSTVSATASVPAPTVKASSTVSPVTVAAIATVPSPALTSSASVAPATVAAVGAVPAPTVSGGSTVPPSAVAAIASVPAPAVSAGGSATAAPSTVTAVAAVPTPTLNTGSRVTAATVVATASVPTPTVGAGAGATVTPTTVTGTASVPTPTVRLGALPTPVAVTAAASVPAPVMTTSSNLLAVTVTAVAAVPTPAVVSIVAGTAHSAVGNAPSATAATMNVPTATGG